MFVPLSESGALETSPFFMNIVFVRFRLFHMRDRNQPASLCFLDVWCYEYDVVSKAEMMLLPAVDLHSHVIPFQLTHNVFESGAEEFERDGIALSDLFLHFDDDFLVEW